MVCVMLIKCRWCGVEWDSKHCRACPKCVGRVAALAAEPMLKVKEVSNAHYHRAISRS